MTKDTSNTITPAEWEAIASAVSRLRASVMATVGALFCGLGLFMATALLLIQGGPEVGPTLSLLNNYYPGYSVTWPGAFLGLFYGAITGGVLGWTTAMVYNTIARARQADD